MDNLVDVLKTKLKEPRSLIILALLGGLILGLIIGWGLFPVQWTDASAENLRPDLRIDFLRNAITTYTLTGDQVKAVQAFKELGEYADTTLAELQAAPGFLNPEQINRFVNAVKTPGAAAIPGLAPSAGSEGTVTDGENASDGKSSGLLTLGLVLLAILIVGSGLVYYFFFHNKVETGQVLAEDTSPHTFETATGLDRQMATPASYRPQAPMAQPARQPAPEAGEPIAAAPMAVKNNHVANQPPAKPVAQFMTTYMYGDDLYDDSFTFDAPNGEFLGECGVSISDLIGVGEPKKISAFEIWLFDKNDVQTVTKVMMSEHTFGDPAMRQRLELKGEPLLAEPGRQFTLETATLRLEAHIVDISYGDMPLPTNSYFQRSTIELAVYRK